MVEHCRARGGRKADEWLGIPFGLPLQQAIGQ
jgi:hypothetical protein